MYWTAIVQVRTRACSLVNKMDFSILENDACGNVLIKA